MSFTAPIRAEAVHDEWHVCLSLLEQNLDGDVSSVFAEEDRVVREVDHALLNALVGVQAEAAVANLEEERKKLISSGSRTTATKGSSAHIL